ncbi:ATP-binding protein [Streptomyces sp. RP5T]|uniref:sensor histidine kinase n=1 Tax=Streptomyces sp. RP5T TaxID=2490848 RepID=UPI000F648450|nr:ATP-binding protein [Streptomyces sp. RP5T]RRR74441.1 HAMP domain-containing protein [Streptomyces sp. RP5T]
MTGTSGIRACRARTRKWPLGTRLLVRVGATLVVVCVATGVLTVLLQRAHLMGALDDRVLDSAQRALGAASSPPDSEDDPAARTMTGQPAGTLSARLNGKGAVVSATVVVLDVPAQNAHAWNTGTQNTGTQSLGTDQRTALAGIRADGAMHTRTVPGLGTYRVTVLVDGDVRVLAGLPVDEVQDMIRTLVAIEAGVAAAGLAVAGGVCAVVVRRQLRPLGRVAATAAEVCRAPLDPGEVTGLPRVAARDTDPGTEAGQVGAALNRLLDQVESSLTERRRGEERMRSSEERMRRFLADASHELRTPLASIAGYAELMNRGTDRVEPWLAWRRVSAESARMTGLVEDLLLLARLDEGRPLDSREVDVTALVAEAVWQARMAADSHDWQLELSLDEPALVAGDESRLHRVVAGLLSNARMHTPAGTRVTAAVESTAEHCVIRVRDNGPGIPAALLPTVFERFTRADTSRSRTRTDADSAGLASPGSPGGSGLGLAVAAAVTRAHGGRIRVDSVPGRTEFTIDLPAAPEPEVGQRAVSGSGASVTSRI